jgi:hypothetical protein
MGKNFIDQYSLLHLAVGIVVYFWGISITNWLLIHMAFEYIENTTYGIMVINTYLKGIWPGGKYYSDSFTNIISDNIFAIIGWALAYYIDKIGQKNNWYRSHI